jgi:hypothetical protein
VPIRAPAARWLIVASWSTGPAAVYVLAALAHAALVERNLTVDIGFGRTLAFWIGAIYLALPLWGFLPARPSGWYARRSVVAPIAGIGVVGGLVSAAYAALWLGGHWVTSVGTPVLGSLVVLIVAGTFTLWLAGREERPRPDEPVA